MWVDDARHRHLHFAFLLLGEPQCRLPFLQEKVTCLITCNFLKIKHKSKKILSCNSEGFFVLVTPFWNFQNGWLWVTYMWRHSDTKRTGLIWIFFLCGNLRKHHDSSIIFLWHQYVHVRHFKSKSLAYSDSVWVSCAQLRILQMFTDFFVGKYGIQ